MPKRKQCNDADPADRLDGMLKRLPTVVRKSVRSQIASGISAADLTLHLAATMQYVLDAQVDDWLHARERAMATRQQVDELTKQISELPATTPAVDRETLEKRRRVLETQVSAPTAALRALTGVSEGQRKLLEALRGCGTGGGRVRVDMVTDEDNTEAAAPTVAFQQFNGPDLGDAEEGA